MTLSSIFKKIRMWGVRGVIDYFYARLEHWRWHRFFMANASLYRDQPIRGITVVGPLSSQGSTNKVLRDLCFSLKDAGIPFQTYDLGTGEVPVQDVDGILTPAQDFRITRYSHLLEMLTSPVQDGLVPHRGRIVFWEFESGLLDAYPTLVERPGDVVAMSDYNLDYYRKELNGRRPVAKILYPLRIDLQQVKDKSSCRQQFGFKDDDFIVFYNFSFASGWNRKNSMGAVRAFCQAFKGISKAKLVLKTAARKSHEVRAQMLLEAAKESGMSEQIVFVDAYMTQEDVYALTNTCDVYLSMHRSEGFGLGIAEAMMMAKPVAVTGYSSPLEFCNPSNACLIPFRMIPVDCKDVPWYSTAKEWADPAVDEAARILRKLYEDPALREKLGAQARKDITERFSAEKFKESVLQYLESMPKMV